MNKKAILLLSALAAVALAVPLAMADPRGGRGGGGHFGRAPARGAFAMTGSAGTFRQGGFNRRHWQRVQSQRHDAVGHHRHRKGRAGRLTHHCDAAHRHGDWRHRGHFRDRDRFIFFGGFGFPYYGYPYGYYPYDYYGYDYGYGYYPYGYSSPYGYDYGYSREPAYGYDYRDHSRGGSSVVALQRQMARAGYYHGAIDGIMGPETRRAVRAYERSHGALSGR